MLSSPQDLAAALRASTTDFQATTALIAAIALFAGAFLIFNTLSMTVVERIREVGLLRAAGASRDQVMSFMLAQALALGVVGSLDRPAPSAPSSRPGWSRSSGPSGRSPSTGRPSRSTPPSIAVVGRRRGDPGGRARTGPSGEPDPAGRSPEGAASTCPPPGTPVSAGWLSYSASSPSSASSSCRAAANGSGVVRGARRLWRAAARDAAHPVHPAGRRADRRGPVRAPAPLRGAPRAECGRSRPKPDRPDPRRPDHRHRA